MRRGGDEMGRWFTGVPEERGRAAAAWSRPYFPLARPWRILR